MPPMIEVTSLSKNYFISKYSGRQRYLTLRDQISQFFSDWIRQIRSLQESGKKESVQEKISALKNVSFSVDQGERLGIIGRNGAGKSTLLKVLSQITAPTAGRIAIRGRVSSLLEVGTGFHPELTGKENIFLNGAVLGMKRKEIEEKFNAIVSFAEVEKFLETPVKRYSNGMRVRLAFAVASHLEPEILLIDEVLAVGDAAFQEKCIGKMEEVTHSGRTVLFVSHNMAVIRKFCSRVLVINEGQIIYDGETNEGIRRYLEFQKDETRNLVDLSNHPNRTPGMKRLFQKVCLKNEEGLLTNEFFPSNSIVLELDYTLPPDIPAIGIGFILKSSEGVVVTSYNNYMAEPPPHKLPAAAKVNFRLPRYLLNPGNFSFSLYLGLQQTSLIDAIEEAISFRIHEEDIYGTGFLLSSRFGVVPLQNVRMEIIPTEKD